MHVALKRVLVITHSQCSLQLGMGSHKMGFIYLIESCSFPEKFKRLCLYLTGRKKSRNRGVRPFATPWTVAYHASMSFTISWSLLKLMSFVVTVFGLPRQRLPANAGDMRDAGLLRGWGRSPGEGNGYRLQ